MSFHLLVWRTSLIIIKPLIKHSISKKNGPKQCSTKYTVEWEVIKNYQYHLSPDEKKKHTPNLHFGTALRWWAAWRQSAGWIWRFQPQFQPLRLWGHGFLERKKPPKAICMRYAEVMVYFKGEKMWIWEKLVFQFVFFLAIVEKKQHPSEGEKMQPTSTNQSDSRFTFFYQ